MSTGIPARSRKLVTERQMGFCALCGNNGSEWHHRRRRAVKAGHDPHCACIGVWLCGTCHRWCHANPKQAKEIGYIIPPHESEPWTIPLKTYVGWILNGCDGTVAFYDRSGP